MEGTFHYMLMAEQAMVQKHILRTLKDTGLTMGQPKVLEYLMEHDGAEQKEIAAGCHVEASSLTSILNRMERDGLIERRMLHGNRRSYHIFVTAKALQKWKTAHSRGSPRRKKRHFSTRSRFCTRICSISENRNKSQTTMERKEQLTSWKS